MYLADFIYDGKQLSTDFGCIICDFSGSKNEEEISAGSTITFNQIKLHSGKYNPLSSTVYEDCIHIEFDIMKDPCNVSSQDDLKFTQAEIRELMRWLNRREFIKFQPIDASGNNYPYYFYGSFNVELKRIMGEVVGLILTMTTNSPFAWAKYERHSYTISAPNGYCTVEDPADEIGFVYPNVTITSTAVDEAADYNSRTKIGTVEIWNEMFTEGSGYRKTRIEMEQDGDHPETITMTGLPMLISTNHAAHSLANGFNYKFLRIGNTATNNANKIHASVPCTITIEYEYPIKNII